ncbi:uncharacterized protein KY384_008933 [Bacidia gigantensis]|uniref:uncharacterized protein n=1 Tax=Bacidia gigantensis TaxID=2732470 RepID=UPI001D052140|nr:uncharacterized protein KY384_008933 [Bacidia gigantensis]KAG8525289.1 hypothetical protein KY384_008933 [Bacidia gigantensis]
MSTLKTQPKNLKRVENRRSSTCFFLVVPPEIRVRIYKYTLASTAKSLRPPRKVTVGPDGRRRLTRALRHSDGTILKQAFNAVLLLNRQIHEEAIHVFYSINHFQFTVDRPPATFFAPPVQIPGPEPRLLESRRADLIRHMSLKIPEFNEGKIGIFDKYISYYVKCIRNHCPLVRHFSLHIVPESDPWWATAPVMTRPFRETQEALHDFLCTLTTFELICRGTTRCCEQVFEAYTALRTTETTVYSDCLAPMKSARYAWPQVHLTESQKQAIKGHIRAFKHRGGGAEGVGSKEVRGFTLFLQCKLFDHLLLLPVPPNLKSPKMGRKKAMGSKQAVKKDISKKDITKNDATECKPCRLLGLPLEIRVDIYKLALISTAKCLRHPRELTNNARQCHQPFTKSISRRAHKIKRAPTGLLRVNHQVHTETLDLFYAVNNFQFKMHHLEPTWRAVYPDRPPLTTLLSTQKYMPKIKHLSLKYPKVEEDLLTIPRETIDDTFSWYIDQIRTICPALDTLTLHIVCVHPVTRRASDFRQLPQPANTVAAINQILPSLKAFEMVYFGYTQSYERLRFQIADPSDWIPRVYRCCTPIDANACQCDVAPSVAFCRRHYFWEWPGVSLGFSDDDRFSNRNKHFERHGKYENATVGGTTAFVDANDREWEEIRGYILHGGRWNGGRKMLV